MSVLHRCASIAGYVTSGIVKVWSGGNMMSSHVTVITVIINYQRPDSSIIEVYWNFATGLNTGRIRNLI